MTDAEMYRLLAKVYEHYRRGDRSLLPVVRLLERHLGIGGDEA